MFVETVRDVDEIRRVLIVDDDPEAREGYTYPVEELELAAITETGPIKDIAEFVKALRSRADAIICDYNLSQKSAYSDFKGDAVVAACYNAKIPSLLCTTFTDFDYTINRAHLRLIPAVLLTNSPQPEQIREGYGRCLREFAGVFDSTRKPWRTLVRVEDRDDEGAYCHVVVPGWNSSAKIRLYLKDLPDNLEHLMAPGSRFHAQVNIGAERASELYFVDWCVD
jgi:CheY-like chemotaxis protein